LTEGAEAPTKGPLAYERDVVARAKRAAVALLAHAATMYGDGLKDAQELQADIADIVIAVYASESGIARAEKMATRGDARADLAIDAVRAYTSDAADGLAAAARRVVATLSARGVDAALSKTIACLTWHDTADTVPLQRRIADAAIEAGKHPF
jgi:hypothetical protein